MAKCGFVIEFKSRPMNSLAIGINRLEELIDMASSAKSTFEKAAIFAATTALATLIEIELDDMGMTDNADVEFIRWGICGGIGYDTAHGGTAEASLSMASDAMLRLRRRLEMAK